MKIIDEILRRWPHLYDALVWMIFFLSLGAFLLALYLNVRA